MARTRTARLLAVATLIGGCASTRQTWTPTADTYGNSRPQYLSRHRGMSGIGAAAAGAPMGEFMRGSLRGNRVGAAGGAAIGPVLGNPLRGAMLGATAVGIAAGVSRVAF